MTFFLGVVFDVRDCPVHETLNTAFFIHITLCNKLKVSAWNAHDLFYRLNNERRYKLNDPYVIKYLDSDIIGIVETKACETDNISLNGYTLLSN